MNISKEKGSITLFTLIAMIFLVTIAFTAYASTMVKLQAQNDELEKIKASYGQDVTEDKLRDLYSKLTGTREWLPGDGTEQSSYKIYTIEDLVEFSNRSNRAGNPDNFNGKYVELMNDVDFNDVRSYENADRTDFGDVNGNGTVEGLRTELTTGTGWQPIAQAEANAFSGTFNGNGNEIKNLYINNNASGKRLGLFAHIGNSTISNLGVTGNVNSSINGSFGGITGSISEKHTGNIINCYNKANIKSMSASGAVGGIVGNCYGTLNATNCYNEGTIDGANNAGGILGYTGDTVDLQNCYNTGEITNNLGNHAGGLLGRDNASTNLITINNSYNKGTVTGKFYVGGILGRSYGTTDISNTHNAGNVTSTVENVSSAVYIGGIVGCSTKTINITNCYNIAYITSNATYVTSADIENGGIIGVMSNGTIEKCYNTGKITNGNRVGGIVGLSTGNKNNVSNSIIIDSFNTGEVDATFFDNNKVESVDFTGRAAGISEQTWYNNLKILNCYNRGNIKSYLKPAGIIRANPNSNLVILNCYNIGNLNNNDCFGIIDSAKATDSISNAYYLNNVSTGVNGITPDPATQMTEEQMKAASFITTLNNNKNSINLADYGLTGHTLSSWKAGSDGYPVFDW